MLHLKCTFSLTSTQGNENKGLYFLKALFNLKCLGAQAYKTDYCNSLKTRCHTS